MKLVIRKASLTDVSFIARHNQSMAWETESIDLNYDQAVEGVRAVIQDPALGFYLIAELNNKVVGNLLITYEWSDWRNGMRWWIQSVYVQPTYRQQGIFSSMLAHVKELAIRQQILSLMLYVIETNETAIKAYEQLQFARCPYRVMNLKIS